MSNRMKPAWAINDLHSFKLYSPKCLGDFGRFFKSQSQCKSLIARVFAHGYSHKLLFTQRVNCRTTIHEIPDRSAVVMTETPLT